LGNTTGALVGGLLVGLTQELGGAVFPELDKQLIVFVIFVLVLLFRPQGLLGKSNS
jgi:branched-chain amino acid transport system permease protein